MQIFRVLALLAPLSFLSAATIGFDPPGTTNTAIGNDFANMGVIFHGFVYSNQDFGGGVLIPSAPGWAKLPRDVIGLIDFVDPLNSSNPATVNLISFDNLGLVTGSLDGLSLTFLDASGNQIDSPLVVPPSGPSATAQGLYSESLLGIHEIQFTRIDNPVALGATGIDNLTFSDLDPAPEPTTLALGAIGLGLLLLRKYKRA